MKPFKETCQYCKKTYSNRDDIYLYNYCWECKKKHSDEIIEYWKQPPTCAQQT